MWEYPRCSELDVPVRREKDWDIVLRAELDKQLVNRKMRRAFSKLFGIQTCPCDMRGPAMYAWDVEAVLERMLSGKLTGTQLYWD